MPKGASGVRAARGLFGRIEPAEAREALGISVGPARQEALAYRRLAANELRGRAVVVPE